LCPVLTIYKKHTKNGINKILLPVDITKKTDNKVAWAKSMAKRFGAEIHIVSAMNMKLQRVHSLSYQKGRRIEDEILKDGIKAELVLLEKADKPVEDLVLGYAREYRPDLLLIMTHQENMLFDNYLGSFAREIIHQAKMPVFSVIPRKENLISGIINSVAEMSLSAASNTQSRRVQSKSQVYYK
jgi:nucleotide-binding universal stress UspA family protein